MSIKSVSEWNSARASGFWENNEFRRRYFDWVGLQLGCKQLEDWYNMTLNDVKRYGGYGLAASYFGNSLYNALKNIYPEHYWMPWRFIKSPKGYWENVQTDTNEQRRI